VCQVQAKFKLQTILESRKVFGIKKYNLIKEHSFLKNWKLMVINFMGLG
jgi:hypothetical protein